MSLEMGPIKRKKRGKLARLQNLDVPKLGYTCPICSQQFEDNELLINHVELHEEIWTSRDGGDLVTANKIMTLAQGYICPLCLREYTKNYRNLGKFKIHLQRGHPKPKPCLTCGISFWREFNLVNHSNVCCGKLDDEERHKSVRGICAVPTILSMCTTSNVSTEPSNPVQGEVPRSENTGQLEDFLHPEGSSVADSQTTQKVLYM
ncbi:Zinc finger protein 13 [Folsomia candida]|uniref:Zinc finger protein 13 n=1 Tax=Folsomia candida TaxID=158441 RepID=A0A226D5H4_FOLCA|nr:Zinc finger protein 13 [Folsomia candida]